MKKIPSLFIRDYETEVVPIPDTESGTEARGFHTKKGRFLATPEVTPGCEWVIAGEGIATHKWDGTSIKLDYTDNNKNLLSKRFDAKHGKTPPGSFEPCQDPDPITGHWPGWVPALMGDPANKWLVEAYNNLWDGLPEGEMPKSGTYELVGPRINGNKHGFDKHYMVRHGVDLLMGYFKFPYTYEGLKEFLEKKMPFLEGIVFYHPDGRMCKIKRTDFGLKW